MLIPPHLESCVQFRFPTLKHEGPGAEKDTAVRIRGLESQELGLFSLKRSLRGTLTVHQGRAEEGTTREAEINGIETNVFLLTFAK